MNGKLRTYREWADAIARFGTDPYDEQIAHDLAESDLGDMPPYVRNRLAARFDAAFDVHMTYAQERFAIEFDRLNGDEYAAREALVRLRNAFATTLMALEAPILGAEDADAYRAVVLSAANSYQRDLLQVAEENYPHGLPPSLVRNNPVNRFEL